MTASRLSVEEYLHRVESLAWSAGPANSDVEETIGPR